MTDLIEQLEAKRAEVDQLLAEIRVDAVAAVAAGEQKVRVAAAAGVSRPTLDAWVREVPV